MGENNYTSTNYDINSIIDGLENGVYITNNPIATREVINKVTEFSTFFNSIARIAILNADPEEGEELINLFFTLKKNIKSAISEIGKNRIKKIQNFICPECEENISITSSNNIWEALEDHPHFDDLFYKFSSGILPVLPIQSDSSDEMETVPFTRDINNGNINEPTDSGIEQYEEPNENDLYSPEDTPLGDNSFRFNFKLKYDPLVQNVIYPEWCNYINKFDQCPYNSIQKYCSFKAVCLLCLCELTSLKKISKKQCLDHILGQRHMRASVIADNIENLRKYHETFYSLDTCYQAHQVYFMPKTASCLICKLCNAFVATKDVVQHIHSNFHKAEVIKLFNKKSTEFFLLDLQLLCYGIEVEKPVESKKKEKMEQKSEIKNEKRRLNSSTSKEETEVEHIIISSLAKSDNNTLQDLLPHRFHGHIKYLKDYTTFVYCIICNLNMNKEARNLKKHILSTPHLKKANLRHQTFKFFCEICNMRFTDEVHWDKHFTGNQNRHSKLTKTRADKVAEYECTTCNTIIYGDEVSLTRHKNKTSRRERPKDQKLADQVKQMFNSRDKLEEVATLLAQEANDTVTCMQRTLDCCAKLETVLKANLEDCKAHPFGSRISGLGNQESDLDLFIDTGDMYFGKKKQDSVSQCQIVKLVAGILRKQKGEFEKIHEVPTARTPIVKITHIGTKLECDLSFKHGLSVENTKFLRLCLDLQPMAQQFILILKKWSEYNKLTEHITTYALAILAIFYLQVQGYLLSVKKLKELNPQPAPVIDGWETIKYTMPLQLMRNHVILYEHSLARLLKDFFIYYASFNFFEDTVCPLLGHTIKRKLFEDPKNLPLEMESYVKQLKGQEPEQFRFMSPCCIQDPFDLSHNLTKACQSNTLTIFKNFCYQSYQLLELL